MEKKKTRYLYLDVMNILACIAVVTAHHNNQLHTFEDSWRWTFSLGVECLVYWAVPVFLMISGATLMGFHQRCSLKTYFTRRFTRTVIPWLLWSIGMLIWKTHTGQITVEEPGFSAYAGLILRNGVEGIYWFFGTLFGCYLMIPVLTYLTPYRKALWYGVALIFTLSLLQPLVSLWTPLSDDGVNAVRNSLIVYILLGYLLNTAEFSKKQRLALYFAGIMAVVFRFSVTYLVSMDTQTTSLLVRGTKMCNTIVFSSAVFVFLKNVDWERIIPQKAKKLVTTLASYSFGVYLLHKVVIYYELEFLGLTLKSMAFKTVCVALTYGISVLIIYCLKKIPLIGKYIC